MTAIVPDLPTDRTAPKQYERRHRPGPHPLHDLPGSAALSEHEPVHQGVEPPVAPQLAPDRGRCFPFPPLSCLLARPSPGPPVRLPRQGAD